MLNEEQYNAVFHGLGPILVLAGAGSGKTRVITERIASLIERHVPPDAITAVTFTNKAAQEMRDRLTNRLGKQAKKLRICTFHALGLQIVREEAKRLGMNEKLSVFAGAEQRSVLRTVLQEMNQKCDAEAVDAELGRISRLKNGMERFPSPLLNTIRDRYDALLRKLNAVDFDDLLLLPLQLLQNHPDVLALWRERARYFLVDEYQDSSRVQYDLVKLLVPPTGNLTVVGDDDQSIYGWRGAEVRNLFLLERDYPTLKIIRLEQNYRSTGAILTTANTLIANNSERLGKNLRSSMGTGRSVRIWESDTPEDEAERLGADIIAARQANDGKWADFAVLFRASYQARPLEMALRAKKIPYHLTGGLSFFDRAEIRDVLSYMRLMANVQDDLAFVRAIARPRRGIGEKALADLGEFANARNLALLEACVADDLDLGARQSETLANFGNQITGWEDRFLRGEPDVAFDSFFEESGLKAAIIADSEEEQEATKRLQNVADLRRWWLTHAEYGGGLPDFMQKLSLISAQEDEAGDQVRLMTVHAAKGLEFDYVYVIGMHDGGFPHQSAVDEGRLEEERRLMYVAMTRARFRLTLSYSQTRRHRGGQNDQRPSPFLRELGDECVEWVDRNPAGEEAQEEVAAHQARLKQMFAGFKGGGR